MCSYYPFLLKKKTIIGQYIVIIKFPSTIWRMKSTLKKLISDMLKNCLDVFPGEEILFEYTKKYAPTSIVKFVQCHFMQTVKNLINGQRSFQAADPLLAKSILTFTSKTIQTFSQYVFDHLQKKKNDEDELLISNKIDMVACGISNFQTIYSLYYLDMTLGSIEYLHFDIQTKDIGQKKNCVQS